MLWVSVLTTVMVLLVYKYLSSQEAIKEVKDRVKAHILEIRLFQDDPVLMGRAVRAVLLANLKYLGLNLKPFLIVFLPIFLMLVQMETRFGYRPLLPNESALVRTFWRSAHPGDKGPGPTLLAGDGLSLESPPVRIENGREIQRAPNGVRPRVEGRSRPPPGRRVGEDHPGVSTKRAEGGRGNSLAPCGPAASPGWGSPGCGDRLPTKGLPALRPHDALALAVPGRELAGRVPPERGIPRAVLRKGIKFRTDSYDLLGQETDSRSVVRTAEARPPENRWNDSF